MSKFKNKSWTESLLVGLPAGQLSLPLRATSGWLPILLSLQWHLPLCDSPSSTSNHFVNGWHRASLSARSLFLETWLLICPPMANLPPALSTKSLISQLVYALSIPLLDTSVVKWTIEIPCSYFTFNDGRGLSEALQTLLWDCSKEGLQYLLYS